MALDGRENGNRGFRQGGPDAHDGSADQHLGDAPSKRKVDSFIHQNVRSFGQSVYEYSNQNEEQEQGHICYK